MKRTKLTVISKQFKAFMAVMVVLFSSVFAYRAYNFAGAAGSAAVTLSPGSTSYTVGNAVSVTVGINAGANTAVGADVTVTYDTTKLTYVSKTEAATPLEASLTSQVSAGSIRVARATFGAGGAGSFTFMTLNFTAAAAGAANVTVSTAAVTNAADGSNMWNGAQTAVTYTINSVPSPTPTPTPPPAATPTPTPKPGATATPKPSTAPTPSPTLAPGATAVPTAAPTTSGGTGGTGGSAATPTPSNEPDGEVLAQQPTPGYAELVADGPTVIKNTTKIVIIGIKTTKPVTAKLAYGLDNQFGITSQPTALGVDHSIEIPTSDVVSGRTYTYKVILTDEAGTVFESGALTFRVKGYRIKLTLLDKKGNPLRKTKVELHSEVRTGETDEDGAVVFEDVQSGPHELHVITSNKKIVTPIAVADVIETAENGEEVIPLQEQTVTLATGRSNVVTYGVIGAAACLLLIAAGIFGGRFVRQRRKAAWTGVTSGGSAYNDMASRVSDAASIEANEDQIIKPGGSSSSDDASDSLYSSLESDGGGGPQVISSQTPGDQSIHSHGFEPVNYGGKRGLGRGNSNDGGTAAEPTIIRPNKQD